MTKHSFKSTAIYRLATKNSFSKIVSITILAGIVGLLFGTVSYFSYQGWLGKSANAAQIEKPKVSPKILAVVKVERAKEKSSVPAYDAKLVAVLQNELKGRTENFTARDGYLETMNDLAKAMHLPMITENNIDSLKDCKFLVPLSPFLKEKGLEPDLAFCTPALNDFLEKLSIEFSGKFGQRLTINSAVRTLEKQKKLARKNKNAARTEGSMHCRGCAADISYKGLSKKEITWLQAKFLAAGSKVWVTKERLGYINFHIVVFS